MSSGSCGNLAGRAVPISSESGYGGRDGVAQNPRAQNDFARLCGESYGFFGGSGAGFEGTGCEEAGAVLDAGGLPCGAGAGDVGKGVVGVVAGVFLEAGLETCCKTDPPCTTALSVRIIRARAQIMNMMAHHVVACERIVAAPRGPKAVWLPAPPKAPARSAALPLCRRTTMIKTRQFITKKTVSNGPAQRKPMTMIARPIRMAIVHFIQLGISISLRNLLQCLQTISLQGSLRPPARRLFLPAPSNPEYCQA